MRNKLLIVLLLCAALLFAGCIPSQYTKGVDAKDYPDKDLPVYDDAVIYEYESDDDEVTIKFGTEDDVEDVAEFYQEYFEDEGITLNDEEAEDDEYSAEGFYEDFEFEISVEEASGKNEEKVFEATAEVSVKFLTDEEIEERTGGNLGKEIVGFWHALSASEGGAEEDISEFGFAMEFFADGTYDMYFFYTNEGMTGADWNLDEEGTLTYSDPTTSDVVTAAVRIEKEGKDTYLIMTEDGSDIKFEKVEKDDFLEGSLDLGLDDVFDEDTNDEDVELGVPEIAEREVLNQDGFVITLKGFESNYYSMDLKLLIENNTDMKISVDTIYVIVNGYTMQDDYLSGTVDPNTKVNTEVSLNLEELALCNIEEIVDVELAFDITDYDSWDVVAESDVITIDTGSNYVQRYDTAGTTMIDEQGQKIVFQRFVIPDGGYTGPHAIFYVENNSDKSVDYSCDNVQVNGFMVSGYLYCTAAPNTCAMVKMTFYSSELEDNDIETFDSIFLKFLASYTGEWTRFIESDLMELPIN